MPETQEALHVNKLVPFLYKELDLMGQHVYIDVYWQPSAMGLRVSDFLTVYRVASSYQALAPRQFRIALFKILEVLR